MDDLVWLRLLDGISDEIFIDGLLHMSGRNAATSYRTDCSFNIDSYNDDDFRNEFRFKKNHIVRLQTALRIPDEIITENRYRVTGMEALCMLLNRLAYPKRLNTMRKTFGYSPSAISEIINTVIDIVYQKHARLLQNLRNLKWLTKERLIEYSQAISNNGAALHNCWAFIDGTVRPICRPKIDQEAYYSGHKRVHCVKYQSLLSPDGIICSLLGPYKGRRHDAGIFHQSKLYEQLEQCAVFPDRKFVIYGDQAYGIRELVISPYAQVHNSNAEIAFNNSMKNTRIAVEWGFGKVITQFAFLDFKKNQRLWQQDVGKQYIVAVILSNCHTCLYGSQVGDYFGINAPNLEKYLEE